MRESLKNRRGNLYMARNIVTDDFYIGVTVKEVEKRKNEHFADMRRRTHNSRLHNSIRKYGAENFIWTKIGSMPTYQEALDMEVYLIKNLHPSLNLTCGGEGLLGRKHTEDEKKRIGEGNKGKKHTEETKRILSLANLGRSPSKETRDKISKANKGSKRSEETKKKMSEVRKGIIFSEDHIKNISAAQTGNKNREGKPHSEECKEKLRNRKECKKVICIEDNIVFRSVRGAARFYKTGNSNIGQLCSGKSKNKKCKGKTFKYFEEPK